MTKYCKAKVRECAEWVEAHGLSQHGGATIADFAGAMGINVGTYFEWFKKADFSEAIKKAQAVFRSKTLKRVENALLKKATGGVSITEEVSLIEAGADGKPTLTQKTVKRKETAPDTAAAIFLLTNIDPKRWRNAQHIDHTSDGERMGGVNIIVDKETADALNELAKRENI